MDLFNKKKLEEMTKLYDKTNKLNNDLLKSNNRLINTSEDLLRISNKLQKENQELIKWIEKIINEVGVKTDCRANVINIPYYEEIYKNNYKSVDGQFLQEERKYIIIPTIRFTKYIKKGE